MRPDIYELLAAQQTASTTVTQLNAATKSTYIDKSNLDFWAGMITIARAIQESRTYAHGLPIPETAAVSVITVADGAQEKFGDDLGDTEIVRVENIDLDGCSVGFFDGSNVNPITPLTGNLCQCPLFVTKNAYLIFSNGTGSSQTPSVAYSKVSL